jgi:hypothetical protein
MTMLLSCDVHGHPDRILNTLDPSALFMIRWMIQLTAIRDFWFN